MVSDLFPDSESTATSSSSPDRTWALSGEDLDALTEHIWEKIKPDGTCDTEAIVETLPSIENLDALPYKDQSGQ
jgi:hypothetical protein